MSRVRAAIDVPGLVSEAEALWYDPRRWPTFVDGLHHVARVDGDWPQVGARVVWDSPPGGRGRVAERVVAFEPRVGQTLEVEDERLRGEQRVAFVAHEGGLTVRLELAWTLKAARGRARRGRPLRPPSAAGRARAHAAALRGRAGLGAGDRSARIA